MGALKERWHRRRHIRDWSLRASFALYTLAGFITATAICSLAVNALDSLRVDDAQNFWLNYQEYEVPPGGTYVSWTDEQGMHYRILDAQGGEVALLEADGVTMRIAQEYWEDESAEDGNSSSLIMVIPVQSAQQRARSALLSLGTLAVFPLCYGGGAVLCGALFYLKKLKQPIALLSAASQKIADRELDFTIRWDRRDEMGALCDSFEKMRAALAENNRALWRQMEERKRLNAAFAHDLRTPLTVLRGHAGILREELESGSANPEEMAQDVRVMQAHIHRLEEYVEAMSSLRRLDDLEPKPAPVEIADLAKALEDEAHILCGGKQVTLHTAGGGLRLALDRELVTQACENLLVNAARYAREHVALSVTAADGRLAVTVEDDGPGFTQEGLRKAAEPFYRAEGYSPQGHLGLGLNICRVICQRCGGELVLSNGAGGGARVRATFAQGIR